MSIMLTGTKGWCHSLIETCSTVQPAATEPVTNYQMEIVTDAMTGWIPPDISSFLSFSKLSIWQRKGSLRA